MEILVLVLVITVANALPRGDGEFLFLKIHLINLKTSFYEDKKTLK
jgi:hypothetical protein